MIVLTCVAVPHAGMQEECIEAARELAAASQSHGMVGYYWTLDEASGNLRVIEVHADPSSVVNHIALSDVGRLAAAADFKDIAVYGDAPDAAMSEALVPFGDYEVWTTI